MAVYQWRMQKQATWLIANWKMNGTAETVRQYAEAIDKALIDEPSNIIGVFCPPTLYIAAAGKPKRLKLGVQNCHAGKQGAFTGEICAGMVKESGAEYVIVGHSERRAMGETDDQVAAKAAAVIDTGLTPVICIGESQAEYNEGKTTKVLKGQLAALDKLKTQAYLMAYEPVWAIGSGKTPTTKEIETAHSTIKTVLGSKVSVLYGGSVNAGNAREILGVPGVSGALIGSASLTISGMQEIINAARGQGK